MKPFVVYTHYKDRYGMKFNQNENSQADGALAQTEETIPRSPQGYTLLSTSRHPLGEMATPFWAKGVALPANR